MIELEKTYLAKRLPKDLGSSKFKEIIDIYIPESSEHPKIRLRKEGDKYELTKKEPVNDGDASHQKEQTIILTETEFNALSKVDGKKVRKIRYYYAYEGKTAEFDVFQDSLKGLIVIDFEFATIGEKDSFEMPDFCLVNITQELFIAGGMICGKSYEDIERELSKFNYKELSID